MHNITSNIGVAQALAPQTIIASALNSGVLDCRGAEAVAIAVLVGTAADTLSGSVHVALKIEHADDDGTGAPAAFAPCADADVLNVSGLAAGVFADINSAAKDEKRYVIDYCGGKRFVKVTATPTGLSSGMPIAMLALKGNLTQLPAANA